MKALRVNSGNVSVDDVEFVPREGEAAVRVTYSGICATDLQIVRGYAGFEGTIGHEFVGIVERADDRPELVGQRVVGEINAGCGDCGLCLSGDPRHCSLRTVLGIKGRDGAHAEFLTLPSQNLFRVPANVSDEEAVFVEPLAAALGISERVELTPETRLAVVGDGKLGLLSALALSTIAPDTSLVGKHTSKLQIAKAHGIEAVMLEAAQNLAGSFDVVVEASGSPSGFAAALDLVRPRGTIVLKSTFHGKPEWEAWRVVVDEVTVVGSRCGRFQPALQLLSEGRIDVTELISAEYPLGKAPDALERAGKPGELKVILKMPT